MRGYRPCHILEASIGVELPCHHENGNRADPFAVVRVTSPLFSVFNRKIWDIRLVIEDPVD